MSNTEVILKYRGFMSFEIIGALLTRLKEETEHRDIGITQYKKILSIMIEALENVFKYNEYFEQETELFPEFYPTFSIEKTNGHYILSSSNPILNKDIPKLTSHIERINHQDKEGLKQLFRDTLTNGKFSSKGGAGLGYIEMAKISGGKINFSFAPINDQFSFYQYKISISNSDLINQS